MATNYLTRTPGTPTSEKIFTMSCWVKVNDTAGSIGLFAEHQSGGAGSNGIMFFINATQKLEFYATNGGSEAARFVTNRRFRDPGGWMHLVCQVDTTNSTALDRIKFWINGTQETSLSNTSAPGININLNGRDGTGTQLFGTLDNSSYNCKADIAHAHFVDGSLVAPTVFGETDSTSGIWKPITDPSGITYGTNGYWLKFENAANMGLDSKPSGASNFTVNGTIRKNEDTPSNNIATLNPLQGGHAETMGLIEGNLYLSGNGSSSWRAIGATLADNSGKYYWEAKCIGNSGGTTIRAGICDVTQMPTSAGTKFTSQSRGWGITTGGNVTNNYSSVGSWTGTSWTTNDILMFALDLDNSKFYIGKDGTWMNSGDPESGSTGTGALSITSGYYYTPAHENYDSSSNFAYNFGNGYFRTTVVTSAGTNASNNGVFEYNVPTGYTALSTKGLNT